MNFTVGNVRITVSFLLAVGLCAGTLLPGHLLPLLWLAILLHECGHFMDMVSYSDLIETGLLLVQALNFIAYIYFNVKKK